MNDGFIAVSPADVLSIRAAGTASIREGGLPLPVARSLPTQPPS